ncbi:pectin lyase-like protein [Polyplosphaeria fusca]|uniref:Pectin lyase-like protein n=1 Tax=Polyplosphaeria fusca TaxID=682080 RepID=A0A9P4V923_9PLEO|nr:pectin lyase-like protein [Polyplosphaeria fusca]
MFNTLLIFVKALLILIATARAFEFHVSPLGADTDDGSPGRPFATLQHAQSVVQQRLLQNVTSPIIIHVNPGHYTLEEPLRFNSSDSGSPRNPVLWKATGPDVVLSGGLQIKNWTQNSTSKIYSATLPKGTRTRNLYVNGEAANYARSTLQRRDFHFTNDTLSWTNSKYDWIANMADVGRAEIRGINSFTDRYAPIESAGDRTLVMKQPAWRHTVMGYDTMNQPNADFGFYIQNSRSLLDEGGEFYFSEAERVIHYMPLDGQDMGAAEAFIGISEALIEVQGTLDHPAHDIIFTGFEFKHTTWLAPSEGHGFVDQQTGAYICLDLEYPQFEATRPWWCQMPSAVRIAAAKNIQFSNNTYSQLGSGGIGIGNDDSAYTHGPGLAAQNISITGGYFTQVMGNSISIGGVRAQAHHPNDTRSVVSHINVSENVFYNVSSLFSSTVPILMTYGQYSTITNNEIYTAPYSGICHGYGWGSNDAGGTKTYIDRGLYDFQPLYQTPTTSQNNIISRNLIHDYGRSHTDLGAIYTLGKSPDTIISENYATDADWFGMYTDEASNSYIIVENTFLTRGNYYAPNQGCLTCGVKTANNTLMDNFGLFGGDHTGQPNGTGIFNNTLVRNFEVRSLEDTSVQAQRVAYRSGVSPRARKGRTTHNPNIPNAHLYLTFNTTGSSTTVTLNISNFEDADLVGLHLETNTLTGATLDAREIPQTVPANSYALAIWTLSSTHTFDPITASLSYTSPSTSQTSNLSITGTPPGRPLTNSPLNLNASSTSPPPATYGQLSNNTFGIRAGGRGLRPPYDDMTTVYCPKSVGSAANVSAQVLHIDPITPSSFAGVILRNNLAATVNGTNTATGYAAVVVTRGGVAFGYDSGYKRVLDHWEEVENVELPVWVRLEVRGVTISGFYSKDGETWVRPSLRRPPMPAIGPILPSKVPPSHLGFHRVPIVNIVIASDRGPASPQTP